MLDTPKMRLTALVTGLVLVAAPPSVAAQTRRMPAAASKTQIRLTPIAYELGGSNCSLYIDQGLRTFVGGAEYGIREPWHVGINGTAYTLREAQYSSQKIVLVGRPGAPKVVINTSGRVRFSTPPIDRVSITITLRKRTQTLPAYRVCGEG